MKLYLIVLTDSNSCGSGGSAMLIQWMEQAACPRACMLYVSVSAYQSSELIVIYCLHVSCFTNSQQYLVHNQ